MDPFFVYHKPLESGYYVIDNQLEQNPGIAKHFEYDSVMLGSSMTTNFDTLLFDEQLHTKMVKLSYNAACPKDIDAIMSIVKDTGKDITHVYLCIDIANYMNTPGLLSYPYPEHLYDSNPWNDLKYLLNKDVFLSYVVGNFIQKENTPINEIYWHWQYMTYDKDHVLANYSAPQMTDEECTIYTLDNLKTNLEQYILPYIEAMPNTRWHVFFPPYSMLYWYDSVAMNEVEVKIDGMAYITECLGQYENVDIHYFQNMEEWISDLNHYTDKTHFSKQVTDEMTMRLCEGTNEVTLENYKEQLALFEEFIKTFDYEGILK